MVGNGKAEEVYGDQLAALLGKDHEIQLAFLSACHSEDIGRILVQAGIKRVVAVNKISAISDDLCIRFAAEFYSNLFRGLSVKEAFDEAKQACKAGRHVCCCLH